MASPRPRRARAPPPAKRRPFNTPRVTAGGGRGEGNRAVSVGTNLQVCPPAVCPSSTTRPLGGPPRPQPPALNGPRRFDQIARSRTPLGVQVVLGGVVPGVFASLDPRLISVIPTGIAGRDFVTPNDRTLFPRHPLARDPRSRRPVREPGFTTPRRLPPHGKTVEAPYSRLGGAAASQANGPALAGWWKRPGRI